MDSKVFLFPLSNSLLLKKVTLPYHIFEMRYRQMIHDSIDKQIPIAVVPYNPENNYQGQICVAGIPQILTTYDDGRMDIYITGTVKCKLIDFEEENPYKVYSYRPLEERLRVNESMEMDLESLRLMLERWAKYFLPDENQRRGFSESLEDTEILINYCAVFLLEDMGAKRAVMEAETLEQKIQVLMRAIGPKEISLGPFMPTLRF